MCSAEAVLARCCAGLQDFGLSQRLGPQATHVSGVGAGTPFYVAPEVRAQARCLPQTLQWIGLSTSAFAAPRAGRAGEAPVTGVRHLQLWRGRVVSEGSPAALA